MFSAILPNKIGSIFGRIIFVKALLSSVLSNTIHIQAFVTFVFVFFPSYFIIVKIVKLLDFNILQIFMFLFFIFLLIQLIKQFFYILILF